MSTRGMNETLLFITFIIIYRCLMANINMVHVEMTPRQRMVLWLTFKACKHAQGIVIAKVQLLTVSERLAIQYDTAQFRNRADTTTLILYQK